MLVNNGSPACHCNALRSCCQQVNLFFYLGGQPFVIIIKKKYILRIHHLEAHVTGPGATLSAARERDLQTLIKIPQASVLVSIFSFVYDQEYGCRLQALRVDAREGPF